ncbi:unnamed protein product [Prunus armeniaca]
MAWEIVRQESIQEPGLRSCLWLCDDISHVIMNNTRTEAIEAIGLHLPKLEEVHWNCAEAFSKMHGLRLLEFDNVIMSHSKLCQLWDGAKVLPNLKCMDLCFSDQLTSTPDFTGTPNLENLWLQRCMKLVERTAIEEIPSSIERFVGLVRLDINNCESLLRLPNGICNLKCLAKLGMEGCRKIDKMPGQMECLEQHDLRIIAMREPLVAKSSTPKDGLLRKSHPDLDLEVSNGSCRAGPSHLNSCF